MIDLHKIHFPDFYLVDLVDYRNVQGRLDNLQTQMIDLFSEKAALYKKRYGYIISEDLKDKTEEIIVDTVNKVLKYADRFRFDFERLIPQLYTDSRDEAFNVIDKWEEEAIAAETEVHRQNRAITVLEGISDNCKYIGDGIQDVNGSVKEVKESIDSLSDSVASSNHELHRMTNVMAYKRRLF